MQEVTDDQLVLIQHWTDRTEGLVDPRLTDALNALIKAYWQNSNALAIRRRMQEKKNGT